MPVDHSTKPSPIPDDCTTQVQSQIHGKGLLAERQLTTERPLLLSYRESYCRLVGTALHCSYGIFDFLGHV